MINEARAFAIGAHEAVGQKRRYNGEPYWRHCERVAATVTAHGGSQFAIAAAWLHDTVEDTEVTLDVIYDEFGFLVGDLVKALTNDKDCDRKTRKDKEIARFAECLYQEAHLVKLADIWDNGQGFLAEGDEQAIRRFMTEKVQLLEVLQGNDVLQDKVLRMIEVRI